MIEFNVYYQIYISSTGSRHWEKSETQRGIVKSPLSHPTSPVTSTTCSINKQMYNMILSIRGMRDNTYGKTQYTKSYGEIHDLINYFFFAYSRRSGPYGLNLPLCPKPTFFFFFFDSLCPKPSFGLKLRHV